MGQNFSPQWLARAGAAEHGIAVFYASADAPQAPDTALSADAAPAPAGEPDLERVNKLRADRGLPPLKDGIGLSASAPADPYRFNSPAQNITAGQRRAFTPDPLPANYVASRNGPTANNDLYRLIKRMKDGTWTDADLAEYAEMLRRGCAVPTI